jgi:hypothetical protein
VKIPGSRKFAAAIFGYLCFVAISTPNDFSKTTLALAASSTIRCAVAMSPRSTAAR